MSQSELDRALIDAAKTLDAEAVRRLLESGANPNAQEPAEKWDTRPDPTVLDLVIDSAARLRRDNPDVLDRLEVIIRDFLQHGARRDGARYGQFLLIWAAMQGLSPAVRLLVDVGADPNYYLPGYELPITYSALYCNLPTVVALVSHGARINVYDRYGRSPRYLALLEGKPETADYLGSIGGKFSPDPNKPPPYRNNGIFLRSE